MLNITATGDAVRAAAQGWGGHESRKQMSEDVETPGPMHCGWDPAIGCWAHTREKWKHVHTTRARRSTSLNQRQRRTGPKRHGKQVVGARAAVTHSRGVALPHQRPPNIQQVQVRGRDTYSQADPHGLSLSGSRGWGLESLFGVTKSVLKALWQQPRLPAHVDHPAHVGLGMAQ